MEGLLKYTHHGEYSRKIESVQRRNPCDRSCLGCDAGHVWPHRLYSIRRAGIRQVFLAGDQF